MEEVAVKVIHKCTNCMHEQTQELSTAVDNCLECGGKALILIRVLGEVPKKGNDL